MFLARLVCGDEASDVTKIHAGFFLFPTLTRARFADGLAVASEPQLKPKKTWVEAMVKQYRTSKVKDKRGKDLPLVVPAALGNLPRAERWLEAREKAGCCASNGEPLQPLFANSVKTVAAMTKAEANDTIRNFLKEARADGVLNPEFDRTAMVHIRARERPFIGLL